MDENEVETDHYVVGYRVLAQANGEPDFTEAFSSLNGVVGDEYWMLLNDQPHFDVRSIGAETVYLMPIFIAASALNLLKLHDIFKNELRVVEEKLADKYDYDAVLTKAKTLDI